MTSWGRFCCEKIHGTAEGSNMTYNAQNESTYLLSRWSEGRGVVEQSKNEVCHLPVHLPQHLCQSATPAGGKERT